MPLLQKEEKMKYYSASGEDWVIEQLLEALGIKTGWFVDVGSWNGEHLNNCRFLADKGWQGVMIEGDRRRYKNLVKNMWEYRVKPVHAMVQAKELDKYCSLGRVPKDFDVLSIDIDSWDYWLWYYLEEHSPKIVVIEIDGGYDCEWVQPEDRAPKIRRAKWNGASRMSMNKLAEKKGYRLVADVGNMIYLRNDLWS